MDNETSTRIAVAYSISSLNVGGAERQLIELLKTLDRNRFSCSVLLLRPGSLMRELPDDVEVYEPQISARTSMIRAMAYFSSLFRNVFEPDVLVALGRDASSLVIRISAELAGIRTIMQWFHHGGRRSSLSSKRKVYHLLNMILDRSCYRFIFVSKPQLIRRVYPGIPRDRSVVIPNGVDTEVYAPDSISRASYRNHIGIPDDAPIITLVSSLSLRKRIDLALLSASILHKENTPFRMLIVGDGSAKHQLVRMAYDLNLQNHVHFLGARNDVPLLLKASDIHLITSDNESFSLSLIEAMSSAVPVIATSCGGPEEVIETGITGFIVARGDASAIAEKVKQLIYDRHQRRSIGLAARESVVQKYSMERISKLHEIQYIEAVRFFQKKRLKT